MGQVLDPSRSLGMTGGWGVGGEAITRDCTYAGTPPLILRRAQHERPRPWGWLHGIGALTARGLGMTGGWEVGGEAITRDCTYAGTPPAHTSTGSARAAPPVGMASRHRRTYSAGPRDDRGVGGGWGGDHAVLHLCGHPPRSYFDGLSTSGPLGMASPVGMASRHRRSYFDSSARAAPPVGMASRHRRTYSAGPRDGGWEVGGS